MTHDEVSLDVFGLTVPATPATDPPLRGSDRLTCASERRADSFRTHRQTFSVDECRAGHAEEVEEALQICRLAFIRRAEILAAACRHHEHFLALHETFRTVRRVLE